MFAPATANATRPATMTPPAPTATRTTSRTPVPFAPKVPEPYPMYRRSRSRRRCHFRDDGAPIDPNADRSAPLLWLREHGAMKLGMSTGYWGAGPPKGAAEAVE